MGEQATTKNVQMLTIILNAQKTTMAHESNLSWISMSGVQDVSIMEPFRVTRFVEYKDTTTR